MSVFRTAYIYVRNTFAGILKETDEGYSFKYDTELITAGVKTVYKYGVAFSGKNVEVAVG